MSSPPDTPSVPALTPRVNEGDAAKAAWLSRTARRVLHGEVSNRRASAVARIYLAEPREHTEADFVVWLMKGQWKPKPRVRRWRVGESAWRTRT